MNNKHDLDNWETFSPTNYPAIPLDADVKYGARLLAEKAEESVSQTRDVTINIRAKANQRDLIDRAAQLQGKNRSEFMLESAYQKAQDVILDRCFFGLDKIKFKQFLALLDAPPTPNQKLNALLKTKSPWD